MIYHVYWAGLTPQYIVSAHHYILDDKQKKMHNKDVRGLFGRALKNNAKDTFVFILVPEQLEEFNNWVNKHELNVSFASKPIQNGNYLEQSPRLNVRVIKHKDIK